MRGFTTRFALGALLLGSLCVLADTAQAGPFRNRRAGTVYSTAVVNPCCPDGGQVYSGPMAMPSPVVGYSPPANYSPTTYAPAPVVYDPPARRGIRGGLFARRATYGSAQPTYYPPTGTYQAGYTPGSPSVIIPAGGTVPLTLPSPLPTRPDGAVEAKTVKILDGTFEPADLDIKVGTTVKWTNDGKKPHTVTSDKQDWGSNELAAGQTFTATFTKAGTFEYHCKLHPDMKARITVK